MTANIYLVTNKVNGKRYVGITTKSVEKRWRLHINSANDDSYYWIHKAIRKYGPDAFEVEELGTAATWEAACQIEIALIAFFKTYWLDGRGYNQTHGGDGNAATWTEERKEKHRQSFAERSARPEWSEHCRQIALGNTNRRGAVLSDGVKSRMSESKVKYKFEHNGETLSCYEWSKRTGLKPTTILTRIKNYGWTIERALTTPAKRD